MKNKIIIISCTQKNKEEFKHTPLGKSIEKQHKLDNIFDSIIFTENKKGMSECYNSGMKEIMSSNDKIDDIIVIFCHDDLYLLDVFLKEKLEKSFETFDVVGVAGSSSFSLKNERVAWHFSPKESWSGFVEHPYQNGGSEQTYMTYFGPVPKKVAIVDGLFIAVKLKSLIDNDVRFNEIFKFHGYDTAFCLECLKKNLKIGVAGIHTCHLSHGEGIRNDSYVEMSNLLREQYREK